MPPMENIRLEMRDNRCRVVEPRKTHSHFADPGDQIRWKVKTRRCPGQHDVSLHGLEAVVSQPLTVTVGKKTALITGTVACTASDEDWSGYKYSIYIDGREDVDPYLIIRSPPAPVPVKKLLGAALVLLGLGGLLTYLAARRNETSFTETQTRNSDR